MIKIVWSCEKKTNRDFYEKGQQNGTGLKQKWQRKKKKKLGGWLLGMI